MPPGLPPCHAFFFAFDEASLPPRLFSRHAAAARCLRCHEFRFPCARRRRFARRPNARYFDRFYMKTQNDAGAQRCAAAARRVAVAARRSISCGAARCARRGGGFCRRRLRENAVQTSSSAEPITADMLLAASAENVANTGVNSNITTAPFSAPSAVARHET